jgi:hypothetical protein
LGYDLQTRLDMSTQDSFVLASVLQHLQVEPLDTCYFATRNSRDFDDPDAIELPKTYSCDLLTDFGSIIGLVRGTLGIEVHYTPIRGEIAVLG